MKAPMKAWLTCLGAAALLWTACSPQTPLPTGTATPPAPSATASLVPATATPQTPTPTPPPPAPTPTRDSPFAPVTESDWQTGPADAQVTIVEYGDFQ